MTQLVDCSKQEAVVAILARRLEAVAALRVEAVVQAAEGAPPKISGIPKKIWESNPGIKLGS